MSEVDTKIKTEGEALVTALQKGQRRALAHAITLIESTHSEHRTVAEALMRRVMPATGNAWRIGISGPPGAGKSTLIEALGNQMMDRSHKLAVLAVDPSSAISGGSILGDKTRMQTLARRTEAFIRPSPTAVLGGIARRTREVMLLCEAAGYDRVLVESVGVGQSETALAALSDVFIVVLPPAAGDALQGLKRGIMEWADLVVVSHADGDTLAAARRTAADYRAALGSALGLARARSCTWVPQVLLCSAFDADTVTRLVAAIDACHLALSESGEIARRRHAQLENSLWSEAAHILLQQARRTPQATALMPDLLDKMQRGDITITAAARALVAAAMHVGTTPRGYPPTPAEPDDD